MGGWTDQVISDHRYEQEVMPCEAQINGDNGRRGGNILERASASSRSARAMRAQWRKVEVVLQWKRCTASRCSGISHCLSSSDAELRPRRDMARGAGASGSANGLERVLNVALASGRADRPLGAGADAGAGRCCRSVAS